MLHVESSYCIKVTPRLPCISVAFAGLLSPPLLKLDFDFIPFVCDLKGFPEPLVDVKS